MFLLPIRPVAAEEAGPWLIHLLAQSMAQNTGTVCHAHCCAVRACSVRKKEACESVFSITTLSAMINFKGQYPLRERLQKSYTPLQITLGVICAQLVSHVQLFATLWTAAYQAPLSMEFPRQEYWSGVAISFPWDLPNPGVKSSSHLLPWRVNSLPLSHLGSLMVLWNHVKPEQVLYILKFLNFILKVTIH